MRKKGGYFKTRKLLNYPESFLCWLYSSRLYGHSFTLLYITLLSEYDKNIYFSEKITQHEIELILELSKLVAYGAKTLEQKALVTKYFKKYASDAS